MRSRDWPFSPIVTLLIAVGAFALYCGAGALECTAKWGQSGLRTSFGPIQGCLVETQPGRWLPEDRVRDIDLTPAKGVGK